MNAIGCPRCPYPHAEAEDCPPVWGDVQADGGDTDAGRRHWDWAAVGMLFAFGAVVIGIPLGLLWTLLWVISTVTQ